MPVIFRIISGSAESLAVVAASLIKNETLMKF